MVMMEMKVRPKVRRIKAPSCQVIAGISASGSLAVLGLGRRAFVLVDSFPESRCTDCLGDFPGHEGGKAGNGFSTGGGGASKSVA